MINKRSEIMENQMNEHMRTLREIPIINSDIDRMKKSKASVEDLMTA